MLGFGAIGQGIMTIADYQHQEEMQDDAQTDFTTNLGYQQRFNAEQADATRQFNSAEAAAQRGWQERMANTEYQRAVDSLKGAGLNPMLAYNQGGIKGGSGAAASSGIASSGSGGTATSGAHSSPSLITAAMSAAQIREIDARVDNIDADTANKKAEQIGERGETGEILDLPKTWEARLKQALANEHWNRASKVLDEIDLTRKEVEHVKALITKAIAEGKLAELDIPKAINEARAQASWYMEKIAPYTGEVGKVTSSAATARQAIRPGATFRHEKTIRHTR